MLWESVEPRQALQQRFGFDSFDEAVSWLTKALAHDWALDVQACDRIVISDANALAWIRTDQGALVAKWSRAEGQFARLAAISELLPALHRQGVPVAPPLAAPGARHRVIINSGPSPVSMTVQPEIPGALLDITDETAVHRAGACLATLHSALAGHDDSRLIDERRERSRDPREQLATWLERGDPGTVPAASSRLRELWAALPPLDSEPQLIHNDYRASNILTADSEVVAVLDFDRVTWDYRISDLANSFVYLGTHFTNWQPTPAAVRDVLLAGYQSVRPLTDAEQQWLQAFALLRGIIAVPPGADRAKWATAVDHRG